jgi:exodeoxyribonuclease VII large subunit
VLVVGEISGFSRASSGHCYFTLKDANGQLRCAMFRRAASLLQFQPHDGDLVEIRGRLGVYEARGDLQMVVESMAQAGQGTLFEQFLKIKERLEREGLFDPGRKRALPRFPRGVGVVTSLGAAALHDVLTALQRRVPNLPVFVSPASVQGTGAAGEIILALKALYAMTQSSDQGCVVDLILLVRGGGAIDDLWAFNDEQLARTIARSPIPIVCGVGHETDFTIADFVSDLRAPTPTAAAELACQPVDVFIDTLSGLERSMVSTVERRLDDNAQGVDQLAARLGRPSAWVAKQSSKIHGLLSELLVAVRTRRTVNSSVLEHISLDLPRFRRAALSQQARDLQHLSGKLDALDPRRVLQRGFAWLAQANGNAVTSVNQVAASQDLQATLSDGTVDLRVLQTHRI